MAASRRTVLQSALALAGLAAAPAFARSTGSTRVAGVALADNLLLVSGAGGNVVALKGADGLLLLDSGAPGSTGRLRTELARFAPGARVATVVNTHWHAPQTGGNETFGKSGARIIAHAKTAQRLAAAQWVPAEDRYVKAAPKAAVPTEVFYNGTHEVDFGGERITLGYLQQAHTDGDLYAFLPGANVLVVGDALAPEGDPVIAWYEGGWLGGRIDSLAALLAVGDQATRVVASTGGVVSHAEVKAEHQVMTQAFERVGDSMRKGLTIEDMQKTGLLDDLPRTWADPDAFVYSAAKGMWAHHNKLFNQLL